MHHYCSLHQNVVKAQIWNHVPLGNRGEALTQAMMLPEPSAPVDTNVDKKKEKKTLTPKTSIFLLPKKLDLILINVECIYRLLKYILGFCINYSYAVNLT